jgi:hypothetical protein
VALPLDSSQTMQLQLLDVVVVVAVVLSVFQRRAFTSRDDGGVKAGSDDDSVVESGATGDEGGGDVGGGSATKDPTARAPIIGDHYVALADGSKQARAVERGVARHPLLLPGWRR